MHKCNINCALAWNYSTKSWPQRCRVITCRWVAVWHGTACKSNSIIIPISMLSALLYTVLQCRSSEVYSISTVHRSHSHNLPIPFCLRVCGVLVFDDGDFSWQFTFIQIDWTRQSNRNLIGLHERKHASIQYSVKTVISYQRLFNRWYRLMCHLRSRISWRAWITSAPLAAWRLTAPYFLLVSPWQCGFRLMSQSKWVRPTVCLFLCSTRAA